MGIAPPGEVHSLGLIMLLELLRRTGIAANFFGMDKSAAEICAFVNQYAPDMVFVSCTTTECMPAALELVRALMAQSPHLTIIGGGPCGIDASRGAARGRRHGNLRQQGRSPSCGPSIRVSDVQFLAHRRSSNVRPLPDTRTAT